MFSGFFSGNFAEKFIWFLTIAFAVSGTAAKTLKNFKLMILYGKVVSEDVKTKRYFMTYFLVSKTWFRSFYVTSSIWTSFVLILIIRGYLTGELPSWFTNFVRTVCGNPQSVKTTSLETVLALFLLNIQTIKRCYENFFVHVFSRRAKMSLVVVLGGNLYYFFTVILMIHLGPGFIPDTSFDLITFQDFSWRLIICSAVFIYATYHQFQSHRILANLRLNKCGQVTSDDYFIPSGGYFELISSPHMFFECVAYLSVLGILWENHSWLVVTISVTANQCRIAYENHLWYKEKFPNYPAHRRALIPFIF